jgi:hypothetical protein
MGEKFDGYPIFDQTSGCAYKNRSKQRRARRSKSPGAHQSNRAKDFFMTAGPWINHFGENFLWSNAVLILKGMAPYGVVALEEIDRCCERLRPRWSEADRGKAWFEEWRALGDLIEKRGDDALAKGHKVTAGDYYLRAGIYHYNAERFIVPGPEKKAQCAHAYKIWHQGIKLRYPAVEFIEVPYEDITLPA